VAQRISAAIDERIQIAVVGSFRAAEQDGASLQPQADIAFDLDRAGEVSAGRKGNCSAAGRRAAIDRLLDAGRIESGAVAHHAGFDGVNHPVRRGPRRQRGSKDAGP